MTRIAHLTSAHLPFDTRIFHKECRTLAEAGYEVVLVAPHSGDETVGGIRIRAVPPARSRRERMTRTRQAVWHAARAADAALYHFHDPELIPVGVALKLAGKRVVYDVHEDLPRQILAKPWIAPPLRRLVSLGAASTEWFATRLFDGVVAATPHIAGRFPPGRTVLVQNFPRRGELILPGSAPYDQRPPDVAYVGGISEGRGIREMVAALGLLPADLRARLVLAGWFVPEALEREFPGWPGGDRVAFAGRLDRDGVAALLGRARAGLVLFKPAPNHGEAQPNKLFEYMAAGIPVVASDFPLWRQVVEETGCGLVADPCNPEAIAGAVARLLHNPAEAEQMGQRGRRAVETRFNWDAEGHKLVELYRRLLGE